MGISAIGKSQFLLGFEMVGIRETILADKDNFMEKIKSTDAQIIILDENLLVDMEQSEREALETNPNPVIITLGSSGENYQERLRKAVKNTLGVDLL